jgi:aminocarboxymuconate-semialdehyde decarboxylase
VPDAGGATAARAGRWGFLHFDTLVFDREPLRHLVKLWGADHLVIGTDYPFDRGAYHPRGFVEGCASRRAGDKARILGGNAAKLLELGSARRR